MGGPSRAAYSGSSDQGGGGNRWSSFQVKAVVAYYSNVPYLLRVIEVGRAQQAVREAGEATLDIGAAR